MNLGEYLSKTLELQESDMIYHIISIQMAEA